MMDDELLSAYVDGELTDTELAAVETLLRDDPRARELVDQLRAVSTTLQALPRHKLDADLRESVLQRAVGDKAPMIEDTGSARRWVWAAMALAAALLLAIYLPEVDQEDPQLAQAGGKKWEAAEAPARLEGPAEESVDEARLMAEGASAPPAPGEIAEGNVVVEAESDRSVLDDKLAVRRQRERFVDPLSDSVSTETYEVHLSPANPRVSPADFDQLLATHGIALRNESSEPAGPSGGTALADADDSRDQSSFGKAAAAEVELVLVEAPLADIQEIITACSGAASPWKSLRIVGHQDATSTLALSADEQLRAAEPAERGVAIALDGLNLPDGSADLPAAEAGSRAESSSSPRAAPPARGWATRLGRGQAVSKVKAESALMESLEASAQPPAMVRVLFILHPAAE